MSEQKRSRAKGKDFLILLLRNITTLLLYPITYTFVEHFFL